MAEKAIAPAAEELLIELADRAIVAGLDGRRPSVPDPAQLPPDLRQACGSFVSLHVRGQLNGCVGAVESSDPLGAAVGRHAWSAAFADPRLPPLNRLDYPDLEIEVSMLSALAPISSASRLELLENLRPRIDGLLIATDTTRAVFLPTVWTQLPDPDEFLDRLAHKAGIDIGVWPSDMDAFVFTTESVSGRPNGRPAPQPASSSVPRSTSRS